MSKLFISYSRTDEAFVRRLAAHLDSLGVEIWLDVDNIPAGTKWSTAIQQGLRTCDLMLLILSPDSMASNNVEDEWQYYLDEKKPIIPILYQPADIHFQLRRIQYIDFHKQDYDRALEQLHKELSRQKITLKPLSAPPLVKDPATTPKPIAPKTSKVKFPLPLPEWINIPAGRVTLEENAGTYDIAPFAIAKYPVINEQYQAFIDDGGYQEDRWWKGLDQREQAPKEPSWNTPNHPRETVNWYEAMAFCRWLAFKTKLPITLPTEMQWQWAAVGDTGWNYPYGKTFETSKSNTIESGINQTTPVNQYPQGASPFGVLDMSGNVWEWTLTEYKNPDSNDNARVVRGGSWFRSQGLARAAYRHYSNPNHRRHRLGFRVVCSTTLSLLSAQAL